MSDDLRSLLHALADRLADGTRPAGPGAAPIAVNAENTQALLNALSALADGDLSFRAASLLDGTPEGARLTEAITRVRELHLAAQGALGGGSGRLDEVRSAAEKAADTASRQRVSLDRVVEQLKQVTQRVDELAASATEMGDTSDRASLLALNTGIEGLRVGGEVARTLGSLGEELRKLSQRTAGGARELAGGLKTIVEQSRGVLTTLDDARNAARQSGEEASRAATAAEAARRADKALATAVSRFHLMDEQTEALVAQIESGVDRLAADVDRARERLAALEPSARTVVEGALARVGTLARKDGGAAR
jgi:methyl-accepting chemotaxis protein